MVSPLLVLDFDGGAVHFGEVRTSIGSLDNAVIARHSRKQLFTVSREGERL